MVQVPDQVQIDYLILANHVEVRDSLLFISGGGWTDLYRVVVDGLPAPSTHIGIGVSIAIPWTETNKEQYLTIQLEDEDATIMMKGEINITQGRPAHLTPGTEQHAVIALPLDITFPREGSYRVVASLANGIVHRWSFHVHNQNASGQLMSGQAPKTV